MDTFLQGTMDTAARFAASRVASTASGPIVARAWNYELDLQTFDKDLLLRWYNRFVNFHGPTIGP